jgi:hypothetical protein
MFPAATVIVRAGHDLTFSRLRLGGRATRGGRALDTRSPNSHNPSLDGALPEFPPTRSSRVSFASCGLRFKSSRHALLAATGLLLALLTTREPVLAASVSSAGEFDAAPHASQCKCATRCRGESCCCGRRAAPSRPPAPQSGQADTSLCLSPAPCADPGLPGAPSSSPDGKGAALSPLECLRFDAVGSFLMSSPHRLLPSRRASRLDKPPERLILG